MREAQLALFCACITLGAGVLGAQSPRRDSARVASPSPSRATARATKPGLDSSLSIQLFTRIEAKGERIQNDRCAISQLFSVGFTCQSGFTPALDVQFNLKTAGSFADRVKVDVDYDSQREFDGSNKISVAYEGTPNAKLQKVEVGNVFFTPPPSRFISSGIPSGNFGVQAEAKFGSMRLTAIAAQQKGNVVRDQVFTIGRRTTQAVDRELEDYQIEPRRFFFTIDPQLFGAAYPNVDILNARQMEALAAALPDTVRPSRVSVYRLILGGQPPNPNGPRFQLLGDPLSRAGQVYELLRESVDYYVDPSQLWIALVRPLALNNERLVVAYSLRINGRDTVIAGVGGTPDLEFVPGRTQYANLLWDPQVTPDSPAFRREIRSVYRVGGEDVRRESVGVRIVAGTSADQEKPPGGSAQTYLQLFGLAQLANASTFDGENRLWPRANDPNFLIANTPGTRIFRDQFLVFPSLEPFSRRGLARPFAVAANDTIYRTPSEYLYSPQHPQSYYRLRLHYDVSGEGAMGTIALNSVQVRPGSERLTLDGRPLVKGIDYEIDYDLGRVQLLRPDTLMARPRQVVVRYEENPLFASIPTSILGLSSQWSLPNGRINFVAISQSQRTTFTRPPLGFEPQASLVAGVSANFGWSLPSLAGMFSRAVASTSVPSAAQRRIPRLDVQAEFAVSQPNQKGNQQAYVESFEGEGGTNVNLLDAQWQVSSQPALGTALKARFDPATFDTSRASTIAFQNSGLGIDGKNIQFTFSDIDPQATLAGVGFLAPEPALWLTLYPLGVGGLYDAASRSYRWQTGKTANGRHWRSVRTIFGQAGSGIDLSRGEQLEFWTLIDTTGSVRQRNPTFVFDFGDVSENSVAFAPETLTVSAGDSAFRGKQLQGFDRLDSERDAFSRAFNADVNDVGLPGDVVDRLQVRGDQGSRLATNVPICRRGIGGTRVLGDAQIDCTVRNGRLDEEDIDQDNSLNFTSKEREQEKVRRYIVDLSDRRTYSRIGKCGVVVQDVNGAYPAGGRLCWVQVRLPFSAPNDSTAGGPPIRRIRALRVTMVSGLTLAPTQFSVAPLVRLRVVGSPWLKRSERPLQGIAGSRQSLTGSVIATVIGTQDRDSTRGIFYDPPPGVVEVTDLQQGNFSAERVQVNERSLRLLATNLAAGERAEAFYRFPEGQRSLMSYREMRLWARGRGRGWGTNGVLNFYVKIGRDADNFYMYRQEVKEGNTRAAWEPEIHVNFQKFYDLRAKLQNAFLQGRPDLLECSPKDSILVALSALPVTGRADRYAACEDGYVVYTVDPAVTPPNLAAVQELAVGMVRLDSLGGSNPPINGDTLELWVDDIRLANAVQTNGYAGEVSASLNMGDFGMLRVGVRRRDPNFRQLGEQPSFLTNDDLELTSSWRLDRFLPAGWGLALPLTVTHRASGADPQFVSRSDIAGSAVPGLRSPRAQQTTYSLNARRIVPADGGWYAPIVNNITIDGAANTVGNRTEFQNGRVRDYNLAVDYSSGGFFGSGATDTTPAHPWQVALPWGGGALRFSPSLVRLTTAVVHATDSRASYLKPASAFDDSANVVRGLQEVWRSVATIELQPLSGVTARWDATTVHDLRNYGDSTQNAIAASAERGQFAGIDMGLERERSMQATITYAPVMQGWLRPRLAVASTYSMLRDPNNRAFGSTISNGVSTPVLPSRLGNTQVLTAATTIDLPLAVAAIAADGSLLRRAASVFRPIDVTFTRNQLSSYDGVPLTPGFGYQLGVGGIDAFRSLRGIDASSAGASSELVVANALALPGGLTVTNRMQRTDARHWARRLTTFNREVNGEQIVYPDLALRWAGKPFALSGIFSSLGATARMLRSRQEWVTPYDVPGQLPEVRQTRLASYPLTANAVTAYGEVGLAATWALSTQADSLPGSSFHQRRNDLTVDVTKAFPLPRAWGVKSPLRTRASWQESLTRSDVSNAAAINAISRLTDNGRRAFSLNADTDVADNLTFSLQGSRVVTFDRNFNRRIVQTVISAVFQLQFFAGAMK